MTSSQLKGRLVLWTRGSALARCQADLILARLRQCFPNVTFEVETIQTEGPPVEAVNLGWDLGKRLLASILDHE